MYTVHVFDLPVLFVCGTRKGGSKINEHFFISYICNQTRVQGNQIS